ncbi:PKD domain-containing protein [Nocardioides sp. TRM66260-LWL]|uniref:PKD domain-containing protein n=1 Tax=Nocardioides sp. TRM66260-LWL TaxID=2874478 RepID=UPI0027DEF167|nr:PKD domain-containing protein [Nocardioides sp. TRM66260-LWL]
MTRHRHPRVRARLGAALVALTGAALLLPVGAAPAPAAPSGSVVVSVLGGPSRTFTAAQLAAPALQDVPGAPYQLRDEGGGGRSAGGDGWVSLRALLAEAGGPPPGRITFAEVQGPDGVSHPLARGELVGGFAGGLVPAVSAQAGGVTYVRPLRGGDDANLSPDPNRQGFEQTPGRLTVLLHTTGRLLDVEVEADRVDEDTYRLAAKVDDPPPGLALAWTFGDGTSGTGPKVEHTWTGKPGTYPVTLQARGGDGSWGRAAPTSVDVTAPRQPSPTPSPTAPSGSPTGTPTAIPTGGPTDAPTDGPSGSPGPGDPTPTGRPTTPHGGHGQATPDRGDDLGDLGGVGVGLPLDGSGGRPIGPFARGRAVTPPSGPTAAGLDVGSLAAPAPAEAARPLADGRLRVRGVLLTSAGPIAPASATPVSAAPRTVGQAMLLPVWVAHLMLLAGLIGVGMLRETAPVLRRPRPVSDDEREERR